jgi:hypothetical protein
VDTSGRDPAEVAEQIAAALGAGAPTEPRR